MDQNLINMPKHRTTFNDVLIAWFVVPILWIPFACWSTWDWATGARRA